MADDVEDKTTEVLDEGATGDDAKQSSGDEPEKDKDEGGAAGGSDEGEEDPMAEMLEKYDLDSVEDLIDQFDNLAELKKVIGNRDVKKLVEDSEEFERVQAYWAEQEAKQKEENETPEETIERLKKEKADAEKRARQVVDTEKQAREAQRSIEGFNRTVTGIIESDKNVPKEYRPFLSEFMGVNNPINEIDLDDKRAIKKLTKAGIKKMMDFEQTIIKRYVEGKSKIPKIKSPAGEPEEKAKGPKNLKDARRIMSERLRKLSSFGGHG